MPTLEVVNWPRMVYFAVGNSIYTLIKYTDVGLQKSFYEVTYQFIQI